MSTNISLSPKTTMAGTMDTVLVTGASGLIGRALVLRLLQEGWQVHALVRNIAKAGLPEHPALTVFVGDITHEQEVHDAMQGCQGVYHVAAVTKPWTTDRSMMYDVNIGGTKIVLATALKLGVKRVVFTSTCAVAGASYNQPLTEDDPRLSPYVLDYDITKKLAEDEIAAFRKKGLDCIIVSPTKVFGKGSASHSISFNALIGQFLKRHFIALPRPAYLTISVVYLDDVVQGHMLAMARSEPNEKYYLVGQSITQSGFFKKLAQIAGIRAWVLLLPQWLVMLYGYLLYLKGLLPGQEPFRQAAIKALFHNYQFSSAKAQQKIGFTITPLEEAMKQTIDHICQRPIALSSLSNHPAKKVTYGMAKY